MDLDELYREHAPAIVASLVRAFGPARLDLVETAVHEAFVAAIEQWPETPPARPAAWLHAIARRRVIDALRRAAWFAPDDDLDVEAPEPPKTGDDDLLKMMLVCCHPALPLESSLVLALRTLCGLPISALARAFLAEDAAVEKRLVRARQTLRDEQVELDLAPGDAGIRAEAVQRMLYVLFFEGYSAHAGSAQIDSDLCRTAIRLGDLLLTGFPRPSTHALVALFLLQASRLPARVDERGEIVPLHLQDRTRWDRTMIERGLARLAMASRGDEMSSYHLEAAIAACHALAPTYDATDWPRIVALYDTLHELAPSPVIALQRAIAIGRAAGPRQGLRALEAIADDARLDDSAVLAAAIADLEERRGNVRAATIAYRRALELAGTEPERRFLERKLAELA